MTALDPIQPQAHGPVGPKVPHGQDPVGRAAGRDPFRDEGIASIFADEDDGLNEALATFGYLKAQEKNGIDAVLPWLSGVAKSAADGTVHLATTAAKGIGSILGLDAFTEEGEQGLVSQGLEGLTGTSAPDAMDVIGAITGNTSVNVFDPTRPAVPRKMTMGQASDEILARQLGRSLIAANAAGMALSFGMGPVATLGKIGHEVVQPLAGMAERTIAKSLLQKAANRGLIEPDTITRLLETGQAFDLIAKIPEWKRTAGIYNKLLALSGRNIKDVMGMAAGNMLQSYGALPEGEKGYGLLTGFASAPLAVPIVKLGQAIGGIVKTMGMTPQQAEQLKNIYSRVQLGDIAMKDAVKEINAVAPFLQRKAGDLIAGSFEGSAFVMLEPHNWELAWKAAGGDSEAASELAMSMAGSMAGVAGLKFAMPGDISHMFRHVRPDLNRLSTAISAEAVRQTAEDPQVLAASLAQEPKGGMVKGAKAEIGLEKQFKDAQNQQKIKDFLGDNLRKNMRAELEGGATAEPPTEAPSFSEEVSGVYDRVEQDLLQKYQWADRETLGLMRASHTDPVLRDGKVRIEFGPDHSAELSQPEGGELTLETSPKVVELLGNVGRKVENYDFISPSKVQIKGDAARKVADDLTFLRLFTTMQGDLTYTRLGMTEVNGRPGFWKSDAKPDYYYTAQIDSSTARRNKVGGWEGSEDLVASYGFDQPRWSSSPSMDALTEALATKKAISPDPIVDGVIGNALLMAQHSDSLGSRALREFFANTDPQALAEMMKPETDQILAFQLGSLGVGNSNPEFAAIETPQMLAARTSSQREIPVPVDESAAPKTEEATARPEEEMVQKDFLPDLMSGDRGSEAGFIGNPADLAVRAAEATGRGVRATAKALGDTLTARQPDLLRGHGDDSFADKIRMAYPLKYDNLGKLQDLMRPAEKLAKKAGKDFLNKMEETDGGRMPRWQAAVEGRKLDTPLTSAEQKAAKALGEVMRTARKQIAKAGGVRRVKNEETGDILPEPMKEDVGVVRYPRMPGPDWDAMGDKAFRLRLWEKVIEGNKLNTTPEDYDAKWRGETPAGEVSGTGRESAAEFIRELDWMPSEFEGKKIWETDVFEATRKVVQQQSGRAATLEIFGPDMTASEREHMKETYEVDYGDRTGVQEATKKFVGEVGEMTPEKRNVSNLARDLVTDLEGGIPDRWRMTNPLERAAYLADQAPRAAKVIFSFTQDPADAAYNSIMFGRPAKLLKGLATLIAHPIRSAKFAAEAKIYAERTGLVVRGTGQRDMTEASSWWRKFVDGVGLLNNVTESWKVAYFGKQADAMLADWEVGKATSNDRWVVSDMLAFSPEQQTALLSGKADKNLKNAFRRELVQLATGRRTMGEGSRFSASPHIRAFMRYTNWASGNLFKVARIYKSVGRDLVNGSAEMDLGKVSKAVYRTLKATGLITASGVTGKLIAYAVAGLFRGENGVERWWNEIAYAMTDPVLAAKYLAKAFGSQTLGGPVAQIVNAMQNPNDPQPWTNMFGPLAIGYALFNALEKHGISTPLQIAKTIGEGGFDAGYIPLGKEIKTAVIASAAMAGHDGASRDDARRTGYWLRAEGIETPEFDRTKPDAFYDALAGIRRAINEHPKDQAAVLRTASEDIKKALSLASKDSLAASLRAYQHTARVPREKLDRYAEFMGEQEMKRVYAHDQAIREFAELVGLMEGVPKQPLSDELAMIEQQARLGGGPKLWGSFAERLVADSASKIEAGQDVRESLAKVAESMAAFPDQLSFLPERQFRAINRPSMDYTDRAMLIARVLQQRARESSKSSRAKVRDLKAKEGIDLSPFR